MSRGDRRRPSTVARSVGVIGALALPVVNDSGLPVPETPKGCRFAEWLIESVLVGTADEIAALRVRVNRLADRAARQASVKAPRLGMVDSDDALRAVALFEWVAEHRPGHLRSDSDSLR